MTPDIYQGFDCCRDYHYPARTPRIFPKNITMNVDEAINLYLRVVHPDCYDSCYTWKVLAGGGFVEPEQGIQTTYSAPSKNDDCVSSPTIQVSCPRGSLDTIDIAVNGLIKPLPAYLKLRQWWWGTPDIRELQIRISKDPYFHPDMKPLMAEMFIDLYACDRSRLLRTWVGLIQKVAFVNRTAKLFEDVWLPLAATGQPIFHYAVYVTGDIIQAAQKALRVIIPNYLFGKRAAIPTAFLKVRPLFVAPLPTNYIPPQTVDIRMTWQRMEGCCIHDLIAVRPP